MNSREVHKIWIEQCEVAQTIRARFGLKAALQRTWYDYGNGEPPGQSAVRRQLVAFRIPVTYPRFGGLFIPANSRGPFTDLRHRPEDIEDDVLLDVASQQARERRPITYRADRTRYGWSPR